MSQCSECKIDFSKPSNLRAHVKRKHPHKLNIIAPTSRNPSGSGNLLCKECNKSYTSVGNLRFHVKEKHSDKLEELAPLEKKNYKCNQCDSQFIFLKQLVQHKSIHTTIKTIKCSLCDYTGASRDILVQHYTEAHCLEVVNETLEFNSFEDFQAWKSSIENETVASFVQISSAKKGLKHTRYLYLCHRSGNARSRGNNIRKPKTQGSNKIGGYCPARITLLRDNEKCTVQFCKTHIGHGERDLGHIFLTKAQRDHIAAKIAAKIPLQAILDEIRDSVDSLKRIHLLTKKDLYNIENSYNLKGFSLRHTNDAISVEAWVNELKANESVLFYKPQDTLSEEHPELKSEDFVLSIMTLGQQQLLEHFGDNCICIDGTHGLNGYGFELHTILVLDDLRGRLSMCLPHIKQE